MAQTRHKIASELMAIVQKLTAIARELTAENSAPAAANAEIAEKVAKKLAARQCLQCGRKVGDNEKYTRGLCGKDYIATGRAVKEGKANYDDLIAEGLYSPEPAAGRTRQKTALDEFIARGKSTGIAFAAAEEEERLLEETKKKPKKSRNG